jgi:hypothetical protein
MSNGNSNTLVLLDNIAAQDLLSKAKVWIDYSYRIAEFNSFLMFVCILSRRVKEDDEEEKKKERKLSVRKKMRSI